MLNQVIARYCDGRVVRGCTFDFAVGREVIHLKNVVGTTEAAPIEVRMSELKFLAFVENLEGDPRGRSGGPLKPLLPGGGRGVRVTFRDGEVLLGTTAAYNPNGLGFFIEPAAKSANETRIYVMNRATEDVRML